MRYLAKRKMKSDYIISLQEKSFHVYWERVLLQNKQDVGPFTFSASLYDDGSIVFAYYYLPIDITNIEDGKLFKVS